MVSDARRREPRARVNFGTGYRLLGASAAAAAWRLRGTTHFGERHMKKLLLVGVGAATVLLAGCGATARSERRALASARPTEVGSRPERVPAPAPEKHTFVYKSVGGHAILADVYRPDDKQVHPVILWLHPGALIIGSRSWINGIQLARYVQEGFVVVAIDYRLAPVTKLPSILDDLRDAYKWVRKSGPTLFQADPDRIILIGHSAGGYLALMGGVMLRPRPRAVVSFYGYGEISGDWANRPDSNYTRDPAVSRDSAMRSVGNEALSEDPSGRRWGFYVYGRQQGSWARAVAGDRIDLGQLCAVCRITRAFPPTLLLHGTADTDVPFQQSLGMAEALRARGVPHELVTMSNRGHVFDSTGAGMKDPLVADAFERVIHFVKENSGR
jgi:acetyl esterase/lipase